MLAALTSGAVTILAVVTALWIASMGAAWKVATILSSIGGELRALRDETAAAAAAAREATTQVATLQQRWNVPQAHGAGE